MVASVYLYGLVGRTLVAMNTDGKWYPQLAKSIPTMENGGAKFITVDGKKTVQATWEIVPEAKWSDGKPVSCEDFQFAIEVASSPNVGVASKENYTQIKKVEWDAKTPQKCTFTYDKARWDFNQLGQTYPLPKHLEAAVFNEWKDKKTGYENNSNYTKNPTMPGLYNGPYIVEEVKLGSHVTFGPNKYFYGKAPHIKKIVVKLISNTATLEANLRSGTIDAVSSLGFSFDPDSEIAWLQEAARVDGTGFMRPTASCRSCNSSKGTQQPGNTQGTWLPKNPTNRAIDKMIQLGNWKTEEGAR
jgi:peptide/nickel transport system substrate-binding protein